MPEGGLCRHGGDVHQCEPGSKKSRFGPHSLDLLRRGQIEVVIVRHPRHDPGTAVAPRSPKPSPLPLPRPAQEQPAADLMVIARCPVVVLACMASAAGIGEIWRSYKGSIPLLSRTGKGRAASRHRGDRAEAPFAKST